MAIKTINDTHLTSIANAIRNKYIESGVDIMDVNGEAPKYKPSEMATAIGNLPKGSKIVITALNVTENGTYTAPTGVDGYSPVTVNVPTGGAGIPSEAFNISGDCRYRFANGGWDWFIENYGNQITTSNITSANYIFSYSKVEAIPFTINLSTSGCECNSMFENCHYLKILPEISGKLKDFSSVFYSCYRIRQIPDSWGNLDFSNINTITYSKLSNFFTYCYSLRQIPASLLSNLHNDKVTNAYYKFYYSSFSYCCSLNEILNLPVDGATITNNMFGATFERCNRLKNMTFATNNGTPYTANWKNQTIDLTKAVGYNYGSGEQKYILNYNSGITADKAVTDAASYELLKNDPDWWTINRSYSRYNHDSAIATINSLPDTSAYLAANGGTNTIKFDGECGSATNGGAINTLTEAEIAVATAKGWTVTLI